MFCVWEQLLATIPVESQHWPRQNGQLLHTHITKLALKHSKYDWMCKLVITFRDVAHVVTFWVQSCVGHAMSAQKRMLKLAKIS
jgi:hypothetical protein